MREMSAWNGWGGSSKVSQFLRCLVRGMYRVVSGSTSDCSRRCRSRMVCDLKVRRWPSPLRGRRSRIAIRVRGLPLAPERISSGRACPAPGRSRRTQSTFSPAQRSSAPRSRRQKKVRPAPGPVSRICSAHSPASMQSNIQQTVVAMVVECRLRRSRAKSAYPFAVASHVAVADEDRFLTHDMKTRVESSTAAQHGTEKSRVGRRDAGPEALFHGAIVGVLLGGSEG